MTVEELIAEMRESRSDTWPEWRWKEIVAALDRAGLTIVPKPVLRERGAPTPRPS